MPFFKHEAVVAKSRCMRGKLLSPEDYERLLSCADVAGIALYLRDNTAYADFLGESDFKSINRYKLEYYIKKSLINEYMKIYSFTNGGERKFIGLLMAKYELEYILEAWREFARRANDEEDEKDGKNKENKEHKSSSEAASSYLLNDRLFTIQTIYKNNPRIMLEAFKNIKDVKQFMDTIKDTQYFYIFERYANEDIRKNYTSIEAKVYDEYYKSLYESANIFEEKTRDQIQDFIATQADLENLSRIDRLLFKFNTPASEIPPFLVHVKKRIKEKNIADILKITERDKFIEYCEKSFYGRRMSFNGYDSLDSYSNFFLYDYYRTKIGSGPANFGAVVKYFYMKETEIKNLYYVIEGIRYEMQKEQIKKFIRGATKPE